MGIEEHRRLICRYYEELWNRWNFEIVEEIVSKAIRFRGSLGIEGQGLAGFLDYMHFVRSAFPDFSNSVDEMIVEGDRVAARLTYSGTHRGELFEFSATGKRISYSGCAIFKITAGKIEEARVIGDTQVLMQQLGSAPPEKADSRKGPYGIRAASEQEKLWAASLMASSEPWLTLQRSPEQCRRACQNRDSLLFTARAGDQLCGFLLARRHGVADSPYIKSLAVDPQFRGRGIGCELLRFAEDLFSAESNHIFLCVSSFNEKARKFYENNGYRRAGEFKNYIVDGADEILMHKRLNGPRTELVQQARNEASKKNTGRQRGRYKGKAVETA